MGLHERALRADSPVVVHITVSAHICRSFIMFTNEPTALSSVPVMRQRSERLCDWWAVTVEQISSRVELTGGCNGMWISC